MKESVSRLYKALFCEELYPYGFRLYKKTFYRVVNDVLQTVMLKRTSTDFDVEFDILPLCLPIEDLYFDGGYDFSVFSEDGSWSTYPEYPEHDKRSFEEVRSLFRTHVKPIFERGTDSKSAYDELLRLDKMIYTRVPGGILNHPSFALLCLQAQDYEKAYQHMSSYIGGWDKAYPFRLAQHEERGGDAVPDPFFDNFMREYKEDKELFYRLSIRDDEYLKNYVARNIAISLENLKHPRY